MPIDYSRYPANWKTEIVPRIIKRAGNACENCGVDNGAELHSIPLRIRDGERYKIKRIWLSSESDLIRLAPWRSGGEVKSVRVVLTVAHLDHDEENHDVKDERLRAWCQYCHLNYDASEKYRRACNKGDD